MTCDEIRGLLEEYHDRELDPARAEPVRFHLASCPACSTELGQLESLDRALRAAPVKTDDVAWDRYVDRVRERTGASRPSLWRAAIPFAAAAALVFAFSRLFAPEPATPRPLLDRYAAATPAERETLERSVATLDRDGLASLAVAMVTDPDPARRRFAGRLLAPRLGEDATVKLLLDRSQEEQRRDRDESVLIDLGFEDGDEDLVGPALEMARRPENFEDAVRILRRLDRGTLNRRGHGEIVHRLRELLASDLPKDRDLAVRIAGELEILTEDLVEFLDVPGLGDRVLEFLKRQTGQDHGKDKSAWRGWFARQTDKM